ncbi:hypothetical protein M409DRAFT_50892 [Zasmidium cellare ATCC 36951]|uniref:Uncharacterized protein n=1 Tax=Zasmidium cellare ATCC 36951 TaxID=1080233 RepID=A0A6A6CWP5_ZASCE|nr:uncharacterized protein M409DRAFT_50892 [Zasmidium cellare ATCC 36951]KAF2171455.1 hypothetical protein M409DRAFT_50892 [Zasmidium cellare ATCC 36951]
MALLITAFVTLFAGHALGANITFSDTVDCEGIATYGGKNWTSVPCYALPDESESLSALLSGVEGAQVQIYADSDCSSELLSTKQDVCYTAPSRIGAFKISPVEDTTQGNYTKDLAIIHPKLSNYTGLAVAPYDIDNIFVEAFIALGLRGTIEVLTFAAAVVDCVSAAISTVAGKPEPVAVSACVLVGTASLLSIATRFYENNVGARIRAAFRGSTGQITNTAERRDVHFLDAPPIGYATRELSGGVNVTAPVYESGFGDVGKWHYAMFEDPVTGTHHHHIIHENGSPFNKNDSDATLAKRRYAIDSVRWPSGGFYLQLCPVNVGAAFSGLSNSTVDNYNLFYDQLDCYFANNFDDSITKIDADLYNNVGTLIAEYGLVPYKTYVDVPSCPKKILTADEDCIIE